MQLGVPLSEAYGGSNTASNNNFDQDSELQRGTNRLATRRRHVTSALAAHTHAAAMAPFHVNTGVNGLGDHHDDSNSVDLRGTMRPPSMESTPSVDGVALSAYDFSAAPPPPLPARSLSGGRRGNALGVMRRGSTRFSGEKPMAGRRPNSLDHHNLNASDHNNDDDDDNDVSGGIFSFKPSAPGSRQASADSAQKSAAEAGTTGSSSASTSASKSPPSRGNSPPPRPTPSAGATAPAQPAAPQPSTDATTAPPPVARAAPQPESQQTKAPEKTPAPSVVVKTVAR